MLEKKKEREKLLDITEDSQRFWGGALLRWGNFNILIFIRGRVGVVFIAREEDKIMKGHLRWIGFCLTKIWCEQHTVIKQIGQRQIIVLFF